MYSSVDTKLVAMPLRAKQEGGVSMKIVKQNENGKVLIFRPYITTKDGRRIYPKTGRCFPLYVDVVI